MPITETYCLYLFHLQQWQFWGSFSQRLVTGHRGRRRLQSTLLPSNPLEDDARILHGLM